DGAGLWLLLVYDLCPPAAVRGRAPATPPAIAARAEYAGAGRDLAGARGSGVAARDGAAAGPCAVDDQSRDSTAWGIDPLSREHGRPPRVAAGASAQAVPTGDAAPLVSRRRDEAAGGLGAAADCGVAHERLSHRADDARLA